MAHTKRSAYWVAGVTLLLVSAPAFAQTANVGAQLAAQIRDLLNNLIAMVVGQGESINGSLMVYGLKLLKYTFGIFFTYSILVHLLKGGSINELFVKLFVFIISYYLAKFCMDPTVPSAINNLANSVAGSINPGVGNGSDGSTVLSLIKAAFLPLAKVSQSPIWDQYNQSSGLASFSYLPAMVWLFLAGAVFLGCGVYAALEIFKAFMIANFMFMIAVAVAPIMAFSLAVPFLSFLFDSWLRFLISAVGFKIILALEVIFATAVASSINTVPLDMSQGVTSASFVFGVQIAAIAVLQLVLVGIFTLTDKLVSQLFGAGAKLAFADGQIANTLRNSGSVAAGKGAAKAVRSGAAGVTSVVNALKKLG